MNATIHGESSRKVKIYSAVSILNANDLVETAVVKDISVDRKKT